MSPYAAAYGFVDAIAQQPHGAAILAVCVLVIAVGVALLWWTEKHP